MSIIAQFVQVSGGVNSYEYRYRLIINGASISSVRQRRPINYQTWECTVSDDHVVGNAPENPGNLPTTGSNPWHCESRLWDRPNKYSHGRKIREVWTQRGAWETDS